MTVKAPRRHRRAPHEQRPRKHTHGTFRRWCAPTAHPRGLPLLFSELIGEPRFRFSYSFQVEPPSQGHSRLAAISRTLKSLMLVQNAAM